MKYPMAGDLQAGTGVQLTSNPGGGETERAVRAQIIQDAAARAKPWTSGSDKVFVCDVYDQIVKDGKDGGVTLEEFKESLDVLRRRGDIEMARADLVAAMPARKVARSLTRAGSAELHFIRSPRAGRPNPDETFDTDILGGMERAIWVVAYADWVESMTKKERKEAGAPVVTSGIEWDDAAPAAPASALLAAEDLYLAYERANGKTPGDLFEVAMAADGTKPTDELADLFGHYLTMMAMGQGVSWFDDHKTFKIKSPDFEASTMDGEEVEWSPRIRTFQNPPRARCPRDHAALKKDGAAWRELELVGHQHVRADDYGPAEVHELRNCTCGSTLNREIKP